MRPDRIPLFPLNLVLFPGELLPLHIFEPRYQGMVRQCLEHQAPFGMLLAMQNGVVRVGCTAEVLDVVKRYEDGRMDILSVGREPFRVLELYDDDPLLEGAIDYLDEQEGPPAGASTPKQLMEIYETCHTLLYSTLPKKFEECEPEVISYAVASSLPLDLLWKQQILELRSEQQRQERLLAYLREWAPHLQKIEALRSRAEGNGSKVN